MKTNRLLLIDGLANLTSLFPDMENMGISVYFIIRCNY